MENYNKIELFSPRYVGKRFESHRLPVDFVDDLVVLKKIIVEMAKDLYLADHPDRKRIPKNFLNGISIELEGLEPGSTVAKLVMVVATRTLFPEINYDYFIQAPNQVIRIIEAAHLNENLDNLAPHSVLDCFNQFGSNLNEDEHIVFGDIKTSNAIYNKESRKRLQIAASFSKQYTDTCELRGKIIALDKDRKSFEIQLLNGQKVKGEYNSTDLEILQEAFINLEKNQKIWLKCTGKFNSADRIQHIDFIEELNLLEPLDVSARLEEFANLADGWFDGELGTSFDVLELKWLSTTFENNFNSENFPLPATFPTPEGKIQFEWSIGNYEIVLEVNLSTKDADFYSFDVQNKIEKSKKLKLDSVDDWLVLNKLLEV